MHDHDPFARLEELLHRPGAIEEGLARLEPGRVGRLLAWAVTRPDAELEALGLAMTEDARLALAAWAIGLARRRP
jgi:hypothetical protein